MCPPPRSPAAEANNCFMVRTRYGSNRIQGCGANATRPRRAPLRSPVSQRCFGLRAEDGPVQMRYVTRDNAMPRGCKPERERALSNAERQARYRARQHDQMPTTKIRYRWPADRRSRAQRWCDAVNELLTIATRIRCVARPASRQPSRHADRRVAAGYRRPRPRCPAEIDPPVAMDAIDSTGDANKNA